MVTDAPMMTGKDALRSGWKSALADPKFLLNFQTTKVEISKASDMAYSQGTYTVTATDPKTRKVMTSKGNYVEVYKRQPDGSWKVVEDIGTDEAPAIPAK
jgi:ketosteroid isomerase-like protein